MVSAIFSRQNWRDDGLLIEEEYSGHKGENQNQQIE